MKHRLFHALVISGAALVEGCASAAYGRAEPGSVDLAEATPPAAPTEASPDGGPTAGGVDDEVRAMVADARACSEVGWATTKSASARPWQTLSFEGRRYSCLPEDLHRTPRCCAHEPAP